MEGSAELRIVLLGKTGAGKSSTGDSILRKPFKASCSGNSDTAKCKAATKTVDGRKITVIDTPGYFCTECPDKELKPEIAKCIIECSPGPHAFLIVLPVRRYTEEEKKAVEEIQKMFGEEALKYAVVLFTRGDQLDANMTIRKFVNKNSHLKTLVQKCGGRLLAIDNKHWNNPTKGHGDETRNAKEIQKLLNIIDKMVERNGGKHYTNEMLKNVTQVIEEETVKIRQGPGEQLPDSIVEAMAKEKVMERFLKQAAGVSTGVLIGALLGVGAVTVLLVCLTVKVCTSDGGTAAAAVAGAEGVVAAATGIGLGAAAGAAAGVIAGVAACVGAISGGITGAKAANTAESPIDAAEKAFHAVTEPAVKCVKDKIDKMIGKSVAKK
ncbi:GTPase IMAP family member 9-like isoform X2 [Anguilla rostrata]|uniref:GTPase IMAP family member 9-like isoform X2 n=1 Tax=Anguilla rostrata TaxID=7938 RepID=UPI0030CE6128